MRDGPEQSYEAVPAIYGRSTSLSPRHLNVCSAQPTDLHRHSTPFALHPIQ
jgi:hypothetical protein